MLKKPTNKNDKKISFPYENFPIALIEINVACKFLFKEKPNLLSIFFHTNF